MEKTRGPRQRSASPEHDNVRQPRLAMEVDVKSDMKTPKRTEDAATDQAMKGDRCSAKRVQAGPTSLTSFGMKAMAP